MKQDIHPKYEEITATCSCGNVMKIRSTLGKDINLDVCSQEAFRCIGQKVSLISSSKKAPLWRNASQLS